MIKLPEHLPREQLVTIIGNLIDNALEATLENQGAGGKIMLSMTDMGKDLIFEIEDQGAGICENLENKIFDKGMTSKPGQGHGIGLHLVNKLLESLNGFITITQKEDYGSIFTVYIPKEKTNNKIQKVEQ